MLVSTTISLQFVKSLVGVNVMQVEKNSFFSNKANLNKVVCFFKKKQVFFFFKHKNLFWIVFIAPRNINHFGNYTNNLL